MKLTLLPWVLVIGLGAALAMLYSSNRKQTAAVEQLRLENAQIQASVEETKKAQTQNENSEMARLRKDNEEVIRLRAEVSQLRQEKTTLNKQIQTAQSQAASAQSQVQNLQAQNQATRTGTGQPNPAVDEAFRQRYGLQPGATPSDAEKLNLCINNLRMIDGGKQQWALENKKPVNTLVSSADIAPYLKDRTLPTCPSGGAYTVNPVGVNPTCSVGGHALPKTQ